MATEPHLWSSSKGVLLASEVNEELRVWMCGLELQRPFHGSASSDLWLRFEDPCQVYTGCDSSKRLREVRGPLTSDPLSEVWPTRKISGASFRLLDEHAKYDARNANLSSVNLAVSTPTGTHDTGCRLAHRERTRCGGRRGGLQVLLPLYIYIYMCIHTHMYIYIYIYIPST